MKSRSKKSQVPKIPGKSEGAKGPGKESSKTGRLSKEGIVDAALVFADRDGIAALSMRKLAASLGVEAMSLYHHIKSREELLDQLVDRVFIELALPNSRPPRDWKNWMLQSSIRMRDVLLQHPWAVGLLDSRRNPGPGTLEYQNARLGILREAGFSVDLAAHAIALQDSFVYGFVVQDLALPFDDGAVDLDEMEGFARAMEAGSYPHLQEIAEQVISKKEYSFRREFEFGLELILEGLAARFDGEY